MVETPSDQHLRRYHLAKLLMGWAVLWRHRFLVPKSKGIVQQLWYLFADIRDQ